MTAIKRNVTVRLNKEDESFVGFHYIGDKEAGVDIVLSYGSSHLVDGWYWTNQRPNGKLDEITPFNGPHQTAKAAYEAAMTELGIKKDASSDV